MTQQCAVPGLPREAYDGCFDAANANKSCVRVHGGQSSEFPIYPTTRERGITLCLGLFNCYVTPFYHKFDTHPPLHNAS